MDRVLFANLSEDELLDLDGGVIVNGNDGSSWSTVTPSPILPNPYVEAFWKLAIWIGKHV